MSKMKSGERVAIIQSLRNGVVPKKGLQHILVGRRNELKQVTEDLANVAKGGATLRFVVGEYGAGKTFFLNLAKLVAFDKGLVVMSADLSNDCRLQGGSGQSVNLFNELTRNISTRSKPNGGALKSIVERFISKAVDESEKTERPTRDVIRDKLEELSELVSGYDFAEALNAYYEGHEADDGDRQLAALKWLRGEFSGKMEARKAIGVRTVVDNDSVYDYLKLFAKFTKLAGYRGLLISIDELMSLYQLSSSQARLQNYEQILRILNDINQGSAENLAVMFGGTPEFIEDTRRGLYSHEALRTRLAPNQFASPGLIDYAHPIMNLSQLTREDLLTLLGNIRHVFSNSGADPVLIDDEGIHAFMDNTFNKIGNDTFLTPRETVKEFTELLTMLEQYPDKTWRDFLEVSTPQDTPVVKLKSRISAQSKEPDLAELETFTV